MENDLHLQKAKDSLSPKFREYYDLFLEGNSLEEIARFKGNTPNNAGLVAYRMRQQLRSLIGNVA